MTTAPTPIPGARLLFSLDSATAQLNHGSLGAVPIGVQRAQQRLRDEMEANPMRFFTQGLVERIAHTRRHLAAFLGADPDGTALTANATTGAALVLASLGVADGDEVVVTDHGYGAIRFALDQARARTTVVRLPLRPHDDQVVEAISGAVTPGRTRLVIVDQVTSPTAWVLPVARLSEVLRAMDVPLLVDGAHVPGMLPVDVDRIDADFWTGNLHKWAFAPRGTAVLVAAARVRHRMRPLVVSWQQESGYPGSVEWQATQDYTGWLAAPVGLFTMRSLGVDTVRAHNEALVTYGQRVIGEALGLDPSDLPPGDGLSMRIVPLPAGVGTTIETANALRLRLAAELNVETAIMAWEGRGLLRLSAQVYNRADEYERLAAALPRFLAEAGTAA